MLKTLWNATAILIGLTVVTGVVYPLAVTAVAAVVFPRQAQGSVIEVDGKPVGSELIGQPFEDPKYFWGRPSATGPFPNNPMAGSGTNQGPTNPALIEAVQGRITRLKEADPGNDKPVPVDLVTASGSGLDPHVSPAAAEYQVSRVARVQGLDPVKVRALVAAHTEAPQLGILGQARVNVLKLNLALDGSESN
jgi:K+-transporting ATPase ATPase C chain